MTANSLKLMTDEHSGRTLGKYEILCRLSTGGMSEIFLAFSRGLAGFRKLVVLKQILPDIMGETEFVRMFLDEAKITAAFNHPNIAQVFDLDIENGELFLAMEFVGGATLVDVARACYMAKEAIPVGLTLTAVRDTAVALHYAHNFTDPLGKLKRVIHRDIAEKNIMVTYEGVTKLLDFGIAKNLVTMDRTQAGTVKGTSGYMSPEQIRGDPLDPRSDIFSLGVVMHECLTGVRLFHGRTPEEGMTAALRQEVSPPSHANPAIPKELDAVCLKALQRKREDRYSTALEFARDIERVAAARMWLPEQSAEFMQRLFTDRRQQTRELLATIQDEEAAGATMVARRLSGNRFAPVQKPVVGNGGIGRSGQGVNIEKISDDTGNVATVPKESVAADPAGTRRDRAAAASAPAPRGEPLPPPVPGPSPTERKEQRDFLEDEDPDRHTISLSPSIRQDISAITQNEEDSRDDIRVQPTPPQPMKMVVAPEPQSTVLETEDYVDDEPKTRLAQQEDDLARERKQRESQVKRLRTPPKGAPAARSASSSAAKAKRTGKFKTIALFASLGVATMVLSLGLGQYLTRASISTSGGVQANGRHVTYPDAAGEPVPAAADTNPGKLSLVTVPPSTDVRFRDQSLGGTPLKGIPLPPGQHTLRVIGPDGSARRLDVTIASGEVNSKTIELERLPRE